MPIRSSTLRIFALLFALIFCQGCWKQLLDPTGLIFGGGDDDRPSVLPSRVTDPTDKLALAVGGVMPGRDELVLFDASGNPRDFTDHTLVCNSDDEDIVAVDVRPGFQTQAAGSGVLVTALASGVTAIRCSIDGNDPTDVYEVTVPPQEFIQILVAEAMGQLAEEAALDPDEEGDVVELSSTSPTGNALGSAIRNRISQINQHDDPGLFLADEDLYDADPQPTYYEAVILAQDQFSPTDPDDPNNDLFMDAEQRKLLAGEELIAYDQAVLTAAGIFNGDIADSTTGAFAFRSPTVEEWNAIAQALSTRSYDLPAGSGWTDASFPAFAPIQILIHPDVWTYDDGRPAFVFARMRTSTDPAVTNAP